MNSISDVIYTLYDWLIRRLNHLVVWQQITTSWQRANFRCSMVVSVITQMNRNFACLYLLRAADYQIELWFCRSPGWFQWQPPC
jgi:hypothetical protein